MIMLLFHYGIDRAIFELYYFFVSKMGRIIDNIYIHSVKTIIAVFRFLFYSF